MRPDNSERALRCCCPRRPPAAGRPRARGAVRITRHGALLSTYFVTSPTKFSSGPPRPAEPRRRRGCATAPPRRGRSPRRRAGAPPPRSPWPAAGRGRSRSPPRRPRTPPPPPSRGAARRGPARAARRAAGRRCGSDIGTSKTHSASIVAPSPSASSACSSAARRPAVWTMSSSSGVPRIGTRIDPYSARSASRRSAASGTTTRRRTGLPSRDPVDDVQHDPERHPREADVARALVQDAERDSNAHGRDDRAEQRGQRAACRPPHADRQRHPVGARSIGLA